MRPRASIIALYLAMAVTVIIALNTAQYVPHYTYWGYAPAVANNEGFLSNLTVRVIPGRGYVYFSGPLAGVDLQGSMAAAATAASIVTGTLLTSYNYLYTLKDLGGNFTIRASGPSASALASTLTAMEILHREYLPIAMTGMIGLAGEVLPVGGLKPKAEAVLHRGLTVFYIPLGENVKIEGLKIIKVSNILDIVKVPTCKVQTPSTVKRAIEVFKDHALKMINMVKESKYYNNEKVKQLVERSLKEMSKGKYYSAASYAFRALIEVKKLEILSNVTNLNATKNEVLKYAKKMLNVGVNKEECYSNLWSFEACTALVDRLFTLKELVSELKNMNLTDINKAAERLALTYARAYSIGLWRDAVTKLSHMNAPKISDVKRLADEMVAIGMNTIKYLYAIFPTGTERLEKAADLMYYNLYKGDYVKAVGYAEYIYTSASSLALSFKNYDALKTMNVTVGMETCYNSYSFLSHAYANYVIDLAKIGEKDTAASIAYSAIFYSHMALANELINRLAKG